MGSLAQPEHKSILWEQYDEGAVLTSSLYHTGCAALFLLLWQRGIVHLSDYLGKQLVHHGLALSGRFNKRAAPLLSQSTPVWPGNLPLRFQVNFVPNQNQRYLLEALHPYYLVSHWPDVLKDEEGGEHEWIPLKIIKLLHVGVFLICENILTSEKFWFLLQQQIPICCLLQTFELWSCSAFR